MHRFHAYSQLANTMSTTTTAQIGRLSPHSCMQYLEDNVNQDDLVKADTEIALELAKMALADLNERSSTKQSNNTRRKSTIDLPKKHQVLPKDATIDDYVHKLGDEEFRRIWMRSLRFLKKASKHCHHHHHSSSKEKNLAFHQKVYQDCCEHEAIWFQFFLNDKMDYKKSGHTPHFDTAEQAIIVLSTLADSKGWTSEHSNGPTIITEEVEGILKLALRFLRRLQYFTDEYGTPTQTRRTNMVAHTMLKQVCVLY